LLDADRLLEVLLTYFGMIIAARCQCTPAGLSCYWQWWWNVLYWSLNQECQPQKDGEMLPGKKGISLMPDQFQRLQDEAASVSAALKDNDDDFELDLSDKYVAPTLH
jgi:hypothetical protein